MKIKYSKPVILAALVASIAIVAPLANGTESQKVKIQENPITTTVVVTTPETTTTIVVPETTTTIPETTTTTTLVPVGSKCEELAPIALQAGWPQELLVDVLEEAWSESRCLNIIPGHPNWNGSDYGPLQINRVWSNEVEDFFGSWDMIQDPLVNFTWAWEMYRWFDDHKGCGFIPWTRKCK